MEKKNFNGEPRDTGQPSTQGTDTAAENFGMGDNAHSSSQQTGCPDNEGFVSAEQNDSRPDGFAQSDNVAPPQGVSYTYPGAQNTCPANDASPNKSKIWPWILLGAALALLLLIGGCASCSLAFSALEDINDARQTPYAPYNDHYYNDHHYDDHHYDDRHRSTPTPGTMDENSDIYTYGEIASILDIGNGKSQNGKFFEGIHIVGSDAGFDPGLYYLEGSQDEASTLFVFNLYAHSGEDGYTLRASISYIGNYFIELEEGDLVAFLPDDDDMSMYCAPSTPIKTSDPLQSGCYRVGVDIPEGTYIVSFGSEDAVEAAWDEYMEPAAYVMDDVLFESTSGTYEYYPSANESQFVTVEKGQYLELYGTSAKLEAAI